MADDQLDLIYRLMDLDLLDSDERRSGKVDDLELDGEPGSATYVSAIVTGPGAMHRRLPRRLRGLGARLFGDKTVRVAWSDVDELDAGDVRLAKPADELDLAVGDRRLAPLFERFTKGNE